MSDHIKKEQVRSLISSGAGGDRTHDRRIMRVTYPLPRLPTCANVSRFASVLPRFARFAHSSLARSLAEESAMTVLGHSRAPN